MKLTPGLSERLPTLQLAPPARPLSGDPAAALPQRLTAVDAAEQAELELGGAITALRRRGYAWIAISRAVDLPLAEVRAGATLCAAGRRRTRPRRAKRGAGR